MNMTPTKMSAKDMTLEIQQMFYGQLEEIGRKGLFGAAAFSKVYENLMPVQQQVLKSLCGHHFNNFRESGSIISIAMAYHEDAISSIFVKSGEEIDIEKWNFYASEYNVLNKSLLKVSRAISKKYDGIAIPPTFISSMENKVKHVSEYFSQAVSHRVVAEVAGLGWRGKNGLIINKDYSCAIRFASIIIPHQLEYGKEVEMNCGDCSACEQACSFIRNRSVLSDYRENCRRYMDYLQSLGIKYDICGKCIKACYFDSIYSNQFDLQ